MFLIYINDLANGISSNATLFADETYLLFVTHNMNTTLKGLNNDLTKIDTWVYQLKMSLNPDLRKQAQEVLKNFFFLLNLHTRKIKPIYTIYAVNAISLFKSIPPKD